MTRTKFLKGECQHCAGHLEFPAEMAGLPADCPHCGQQTELLLARPSEEPTVPRRTIVWAVVGITILTLGFVGALVALKRAERWAARQKKLVPGETVLGTETSTPVPATAAEQSPTQDGFNASAARLETTPGTSLVYAMGTIKNQTDRKRFGVKVELELFDANGQKIGTATDYQQVIETNASWQFKALVVDAKAASAKVTGIKEDQ